MFDFNISESGDILMFDRKVNECLKLSFLYAKTPTLKIKFGYIANSEPEPEPYALSLKINIVEQKEKRDILFVTDNLAIEQILNVRMKTSFGELAFLENFGSKLELLKHENVKNKTIENLIKQEVLRLCSDLISDAKVEIEQDGNDIFILVYTDDELLTRQSIN